MTFFSEHRVISGAERCPTRYLLGKLHREANQAYSIESRLNLTGIHDNRGMTRDGSGIVMKLHPTKSATREVYLLSTTCHCYTTVLVFNNSLPPKPQSLSVARVRSVVLSVQS
jgi:hypothetical protein